MALTTYTPASGLHAGTAFKLPPVQGTYKIHGTYVQAYGTPEEMDGSYLTTGTASMYMEGATIEVTFSIGPAWLGQTPNPPPPSSNCYGASFAGMETALLDFSTYVLNGGLGTLTDTLPTGTKSGFGGATVTSRSVTCIASGSYTIERQIGEPIAEIQMQFYCPSPRWSYSDGTLVDMI